MTRPPAARPALDYSGYLRIDDLLSLQNPLGNEHDELLFIVIHQVYELVFKLMLHEMGDACRALRSDNPHGAERPLMRLVTLVETLDHLLGILTSMPIDRFLAFRDPLAPASGAQSWQFKEILEAASGESGTTLWSSLLSAFTSAGFAMQEGDGEISRTARRDALIGLYRSHDTRDRDILHTMCELFVDFDEAFSTWRSSHALMAERQIGTREGTGGTTGVGYLRSRVGGHLFPELWDMRSSL